MVLHQQKKLRGAKMADVKIGAIYSDGKKRVEVTNINNNFSVVLVRTSDGKVYPLSQFKRIFKEQK